MMASTTQLLSQPLWAADAYPESGSPAERIGASYKRARVAAKHIGMTLEDITQLTPKFWGFHKDFIVTRDTAVTTILSIHWNLCMGTIASYSENRPELKAVLDELERFESVGEFMLTEVGHGLDARNIETTATRNEDGSYVLHTPNGAAAKIMPPTTPHAQMPRLAVVFAQLLVGGENRGVRPFIVRINDAESMAPGVTSRLLPARPGAKMLDHAVTTFDNVRLDSWALLGEVEAPANPRKDFFRHIHRVTVGTLSLSMCNIPVARLSGYILGRYSQRRRVAGANPDERLPIITFATQHTPILTALTMSNVLEAYSNEVTTAFLEAKEPQVRSALATIFKQTATYGTQTICNEMIDRCGWQGLYKHNQLIELTSALRGNSIAEGDSLVLCIRLVSELFLGRYEIPKAKNPSSLLAEHELGVWTEAADMAMSIMTASGSSSNRNDEFNAFLLPRVRKLVQATGHRMAYEAAAASPATVSPEMLHLYEASCILEDPAWYVESKGMKSGDLYKRHAEAVRALLPSLDKMLEDSDAVSWASAPILKEEDWMGFIERLPAFTSTTTIASNSDTESVTTKQGSPTVYSKTPKNEEPKADGSVVEEKSLKGKLKIRKNKTCVIF